MKFRNSMVLCATVNLLFDAALNNPLTQPVEWKQFLDWCALAYAIGLWLLSIGNVFYELYVEKRRRNESS